MQQHLSVGLAAIGLALAAGGARAESVSLLCQAEGQPSVTFRVNTESGWVEWLNDDGSVMRSAQGRVTESDIAFDGAAQADTDRYMSRRWIDAHLNRLSGEMSVNFRQWDKVSGDSNLPLKFVCRRATQKF